MKPKDFDAWNDTKKTIELAHSFVACNERDIWWCSLGLNIGHEQDGRNSNFERPILIMKKFSRFTCLCVPLTTSDKNNGFQIPTTSFKRGVYAIISQLRLVSTKRLLRKMGTIDRRDFRIIKNSVHDLIN